MFKEHPNFHSIKFILVPDLKEHLKCTCDIPGHIEPLIKHYSSLFPIFDTSLVDCLSALYVHKDAWFLDTLAEVDKARILKEMEDNTELTVQ